MTMRDLKHGVDAVASLAPAVRTASATGTAVDLRGFDAASVVVQFGAYTDGSHTPGLEGSADGISFAAVPAGDLDGAFVAGTAGSLQQVGYRGPARFLRVILTVAGATGGAAAGALVLRGRAAVQGL